MKISLASWLWMLASIASYGIGEYYSKRVALQFSWLFVGAVALAYVGSGLFWIPAMIQRNGLVVLGLIWTLMAAATTILIGLCMGESLTNCQIAGVFLALVSSVLLAL